MDRFSGSPLPCLPLPLLKRSEAAQLDAATFENGVLQYTQNYFQRLPGVFGSQFVPLGEAVH